jgi:ABC-type sulfate/molybdate transport systems ATPase subunit
VGLIVALSLAIVRLLHYERKMRPALPAEPVGADAVLGIVIPPVPSASRVPGTFRLEVNAERRLETFTLKISFETSQGAVGLLGPSGAGKSMSLRMIAGVTTPDRGRIVLNDRVLFDSDTNQNLPAAKRRIGVVFQDYALFPHLTVAENVGFGLRQLPDRERQTRIEENLASMQIADLANRFPREISGGQRQRVAIARCMAINPDALLLDEPFAALDPHLRRTTEEQLRKTLSGFKGPVVFVTHDMEEAFRFCTNLLVLDRGNVIAGGPKHQLF